MTDRTILGIDPGKMTGWALLDDTGKLVDMGQVSYPGLYEWLDSLHYIDIYVIENFRIRPGVNFSWQEMDTIKAIGAAEFRAYQKGAHVVKQEPANYTVGAKWAGIQIPKDHSISHQAVAYAHAVFYSVKVLGRPVPAFAGRGGLDDAAKG